MISTNKNPKVSVFDNYISPVTHVHRTRARVNGSYQLYKPRAELGKTLIPFKGVKYWNSLPKYIIDQNKYGTSRFKTNIKEYLLCHQEC